MTRPVAVRLLIWLGLTIGIAGLVFVFRLAALPNAGRVATDST